MKTVSVKQEGRVWGVVFSPDITIGDLKKINMAIIRAFSQEQRNRSVQRLVAQQQRIVNNG